MLQKTWQRWREYRRKRKHSHPIFGIGLLLSFVSKLAPSQQAYPHPHNIWYWLCWVGLALMTVGWLVGSEHATPRLKPYRKATSS